MHFNVVGKNQILPDVGFVSLRVSSCLCVLASASARFDLLLHRCRQSSCHLNLHPAQLAIAKHIQRQNSQCWGFTWLNEVVQAPSLLLCVLSFLLLQGIIIVTALAVSTVGSAAVIGTQAVPIAALVIDMPLALQPKGACESHRKLFPALR